MDETARPNWWRRRNWWKIGFFVMLFLFECAREWAVLASYPEPKVATMDYVGSVGDSVRATGRWVRIDNGGAMVPAAVVIECDRARGECDEMVATAMNGYVGEPTLDRFNATFTPDAVSYENDLPECARYSVRIDLKLKKVFAVRERKPNPTNVNCRNFEPKIEMTLGNGYQPSDNNVSEHFVPLFASLVTVLRWFS